MGSALRAFFWVFSTGIMASGCSTISYEEPNSGKLAKVRFATDFEEITVVNGYETSSCEEEKEWMRLRVGPLLISQPKRLGMPLWDYHDNAAKEFYVRAGKEQHLMFYSAKSLGRGAVKCGIPISTTFENNEEYELFFDDDDLHCSLTLNQILKTKDSGVPHKKRLLKHSSRTVDMPANCADQLKDDCGPGCLAVPMAE